MIEIKMLNFIAAEDRFDDAGVALGKNIAQSKKLLVIRQAARHRLPVFAHVPLIAIGGYA
jgi:hypothetical protein